MEISDDDKKKMEEFRKELETLCEKYDYASMLFCISIKPKDPVWDVKSERPWLIDTTFTADKKYVDLLEKGDKGLTDLTTEERVKLLDLLNTMLTMQEQVGAFCMSSHDRINEMLEEVTESLGLNNSKIIKIDPDTEYHIFTKSNQVFQLKFDTDYRFFLTQLEGEDSGVKSDEALSLVGCIQADGEIFGSPTLPVLSTGDKAMFQLYPFDMNKGITSEAFITDEIIDVVPSVHVN